MALVAIIAGCAGVVFSIICIAAVMMRNRNPFKFLRRSPPTQTLRDVETSEAIDGDFETYGNLIIAPDRRPTPTALDIITRMLTITGLPTNTTYNNAPTDSGSAMEMGYSLHLSLSLPRPTSQTPSEQVQHMMTDAEASAAALDAERYLSYSLQFATHRVQQDGEIQKDTRRARAAEFAAQRIKAGRWVDVAREEVTMGKVFDNADLVDVDLSEARQEVFVVGDEDEEDTTEEVAVDPVSSTFGSGKAMAKLYH